MKIHIYCLAIFLLIIVSCSQKESILRLPEMQPFFVDPIWKGTADPSMLWNPKKKEYYIWYTQRRATLQLNTKVEWMHGSSIGVATSKDGKKWRYLGTCRGDNHLSDAESRKITWWAPSVVYENGLFHMYVSYVPGIYLDWNAKRFIKHFISNDGMSWKYQSTLFLSSEYCIDACVYKVNNTWFMAYKDEENRNETWLAKSDNLYSWNVVGSVINDVGHEAPFAWEKDGIYYIIVDAWEQGLRIYSSFNGINEWTYHSTIQGSHPCIFQEADKTYIVYHAGYDPNNDKLTGLYLKELRIKDGKYITFF